MDNKDRRRNHHKRVNLEEPAEMKASTVVVDEPVLEPIEHYVQYIRTQDYLGYECPVCHRRFTLCRHKDAHLHLGGDSRRRCDRCFTHFMTVGIKDAWQAYAQVHNAIAHPLAKMFQRGIESDTTA